LYNTFIIRREQVIYSSLARSKITGGKIAGLHLKNIFYSQTEYLEYQKALSSALATQKETVVEYKICETSFVALIIPYDAETAEVREYKIVPPRKINDIVRWLKSGTC
jgi:hypothetical protein